MTTRRTLLTAGAVASVLPSSLLAAALEDSSDALEPRQQVIVIGSGLAGLTAGASALESGARRVLILEKGPLVGGHSLYSSGSIAAVAPDRAGAFSNGWRDSVEQFVADALAVGGGSGDPERLVQIARGSAAMLDWLEGLGVSFGRPFEARSGLHPRSWAMPGNSAGRSYVLAVMDCYRRLGGKTILSAKVETLERQESSWKVGVTIRSEKEVRLKYFQAPAVIIASGGVIAEGFGLQLLPFWGGRLIDYAGGDMYVDETGRRFVDENLPWNAISEHILKLKSRRCWVITDAQSYKGATLSLKLINGIVRKAGSIREMAAVMRIPPTVLEQTFAQYNRAADAGLDPLTGKKVFTQRIEKPPFYFGEEQIYVHTTLDGILTDAQAQVRAQTGGVIPGLFAAGEVVGGIFGFDRLGGAGITNCLVMGRIAGERAVEFQSGT